MIFSIASEIERDLISKRTIEALRARKQKGLPLGRPKGLGKSKLDEYKEEILALLNNGSSKVFVAKRYKTLYWEPALLVSEEWFSIQGQAIVSQIPLEILYRLDEKLTNLPSNGKLPELRITEIQEALAQANVIV